MEDKLYIIPVGVVYERILGALGFMLQNKLKVSCDFTDPQIPYIPAYNAQREQYDCTELLDRLRLNIPKDARLALALTRLDLYTPEYDYIFGEAYFQSKLALLSYCRFQPEFYNLPRDNQLCLQRTFKEATHLLGHVCGLPHCENYPCVMSPANRVIEVDLKDENYCENCWSQFRQALSP